MSRVAIVQQAPVFLDRGATLAKAVATIEEAAQAGARLIVFPEAFVPGYPAWIWRLRPGGDMGLSERLHSLLRANAVNLAGNDLAPLREAARRREARGVCGIHARDAAFSQTSPYAVPGKAQLFPDPNGWVNPGDSVVVAPGGKIVAGPLREALGILYAQIDLERVAVARRNLDVVGHYARPDLFQLHVNTKPAQPVAFSKE